MYKEKTIIVPASLFLRKVLRILQVLPPEGERYSNTHIVATLIFNVIITSPMSSGLMGYIYKSTQVGFNKDLVDCVDFLINGAIYWMILVTFLWRSEEYNNFFSSTETYRFGLPRTIVTRAKLYQIWSIFSWISINIVSLSRAVTTHLINCPRENDDLNLVCEVGFIAWYPVNVHNFYFKGYIRMTGLICIISLANILTSYALIPENTMNIAARIRHLENLLVHIRFDRDIDMSLYKLHFCIRYHAEIKRMVLKLNDTMGYLLFPEFTLLIGSLSLMEYKIVFEHDFFSFINLLAWLSGPTLNCEMGQVLNDEYDKLRWAVYGMNWYEMSPKIRKTYLLLLGSVQKPINFLVPPIFCLDRICLLNVVKGSYSIFMYMSRIADKR